MVQKYESFFIKQKLIKKTYTFYDYLLYKEQRKTKNVVIMYCFFYFNYANIQHKRIKCKFLKKKTIETLRTLRQA